MTPAERIVLDANMKVLEAEEELKAGVADADVYDTVLRATGSEERASAAMTARIADVQRRGQKADL